MAIRMTERELINAGLGHLLEHDKHREETQKMTNKPKRKGMTNPEVMFNYIKMNGYGTGTYDGYVKKHLSVLCSNLNCGESVHIVFVGRDKNENAFVIGLTDDRLMMARKTLFGRQTETLMKHQITNFVSEHGIWGMKIHIGVTSGANRTYKVDNMSLVKTMRNTDLAERLQEELNK